MSEDYKYCEWPKCELEGKNYIECGNEGITVCRAHRGAVTVNIERHGKIWIFNKTQQQKLDDQYDGVNPGQKRPSYTKARPDKPVTADHWQQEAAKRADAAATPVDRVNKLVPPRRREIADEALNKLFGPKEQ